MKNDDTGSDTSLHLQYRFSFITVFRVSRSSYVLKVASRHRARGAFDKWDLTLQFRTSSYGP